MPRALIMTLDGVTKTLDGWAQEAGISKQTLSLRLKRGMALADAVRTGPLRCGKWNGGGERHRPMLAAYGLLRRVGPVIHELDAMEASPALSDREREMIGNARKSLSEATERLHALALSLRGWM